MVEIRKIRAELSKELKGMSPEEQVAFIKEGALEFEKRHGLDLPRVKKVPSKSQ
ncbi:MAG: hypothetical protein AB1742_11105 [bacterium]